MNLTKSTLNPRLLTVIGGDDGRRLREGRRRGGALLILVLDGRVRRGRRPQTLDLSDLVQDLRRKTAVQPRHPLVQVVLGARGQQLLDAGILHDGIVSPVQALLAVQPVVAV